MKIRCLDSAEQDFKNQLNKLMSTIAEPNEELTQLVTAILWDVKQRGDKALLEYTNQFDQRNAIISDLEIPTEQLEKATSEISKQLHKALDDAAGRIHDYHEHQKVESWSYTEADGTLLGQQVTPLNRVGVYVPGGKAPYPSSVLMNIIPAKIAGVSEIIMVVPAPSDELNPLVLAAAKIAGVDRVFTIGGAQAIAALAYGTETVPVVDKIVGPGNRYVAEAKRLVFGIVGIDMIAGPSEILVVSDGSSDSDWVAMDLFAQAEHDEDARAMLVCTDKKFISAVIKSIEKLLPEMERADIIKVSLEKNGVLILTKDLDEAVDIINQIAPEHLQLSITDPQAILGQVKNAGAIFLGIYSSEVLGDYCAGPNHVLPTGRAARFSSPLGVYDFQKRSSLIMCSAESSSKLATTASVLARGEGFTAHARAAEMRMDAKTQSVF